MSWKASGYVKSLIITPSGKQISRSEKYLAFFIADYHNTHYNAAWPNIKRLALEAMLKERQTQNLLRSLERKGVICIFTNTTGQRDGNDIHFCELDGCEKLHPSNGDPVAKIPDPVQSGDNSLYIEPTLNRETRARDFSTFPATDEQEEVAYLLEACRRARYRPATLDNLLPVWLYYKWIVALCYKARDSKTRRVLTDKQQKSAVEFIFDMKDVADLNLIPRFAENWKANWKARGGKEPPTVAQVREFWTQLTEGDEADAKPATTPEDEQEKLAGLRKGKEWSRQ